jgi:hypothetical protein
VEHLAKVHFCEARFAGLIRVVQRTATSVAWNSETVRTAGVKYDGDKHGPWRSGPLLVHRKEEGEVVDETTTRVAKPDPR